MRGSLLFLFVVAAASEAGGQSDSAVARWPEVGSRVRITTYANRTVTGELVNVRGDTMVVRTARQLSKQLRHVPAGKVELIPGSMVARVEVSRGRGFQVERVLGGALVGAAAGIAVAGAADVAGEVVFGDFGELSPDYGKAAAIGAVVGAVVGASKPGDRWEQADPPTPPTLAPTTRVTRLRLTTSFR